VYPISGFCWCAYLAAAIRNGLVANNSLLQGRRKLKDTCVDDARADDAPRCSGGIVAHRDVRESVTGGG
jgi:hypothetical protein